jgi:F0F1-type ATP synthase membrane subunit b/b'
MSKSSDQADKPKDKWSGRLANTKDGLDITRQLLIVIIILVLIFVPTAFKRTLKAFGVKKVSVAGTEFELNEEASANTGDAAQGLEATNKNLESARENLNSIILETSNADLKKKLEVLKSQLQASQETTTNAAQNLNASLADQIAIVQNAAPEDVQGQGPWGIVISADKLIQDAQAKVETVQALGYQNIKFYDRQNWKRTVVEFSSFDDAQAALPKLRSIHSSSYLVNRSKWCPAPKDEGNGIWQCLGQ